MVNGAKIMSNAWKVVCSCDSRFKEVGEYTLHMTNCPLKCTRCKDWFNDINKWLQHPCKPVPNMED